MELVLRSILICGGNGRRKEAKSFSQTKHVKPCIQQQVIPKLPVRIDFEPKDYGHKEDEHWLEPQ